MEVQGTEEELQRTEMELLQPELEQERLDEEIGLHEHLGEELPGMKMQVRMRSPLLVLTEPRKRIYLSVESVEVRSAACGVRWTIRTVDADWVALVACRGFFDQDQVYTS